MANIFFSAPKYCNPYSAVFQNDRKHVGRNLIQTLAAIFIL